MSCCPSTTAASDQQLNLNTHPPPPYWAIIKGENTLGKRVAEFLQRHIDRETNFGTTVIDCASMGLEEWSDDFQTSWLDARNVNPTAYTMTLPSSECRSELLVKSMREIDNAEGLIIVTGEFNLNLPDTLRILFETLPRSSYFGKPCAVVCYSPGVSSGRRAGFQARAFLGELSCLTLGTILAIPQVNILPYPISF
eukprot:sb/3470887/